MKNRIIAAIVVTAILFAPAAYAWGGHEKGDKDWGHGKIFKELNLTPEQEQQIKDYKEQARENKKNVRGELKAKMDLLRAQLNDPQTDEAAIRQTANELKSWHGKMTDQHIDSVLYMRKVLTPEQFKKFQDLAKEKKAKFMEKRKRNWRHKGE